MVTNDTDSPLSATFTAQQSHTFTVEVSASAQAKLGAVITATVSTRFAWSWTTQVGVTANAMAAPHQTVHAQYGVVSHDLLTNDRIVRWTRIWPTRFGEPPVDFCTETTGQVLRNIPTPEERWRVYPQRPSPF